VDGKAVVVPSFEAGTIVLSSKEESVVLSWKADDGDRRRGVAAGAWRRRSTRIERAKDGEAWFLSSTSPNLDVRLATESPFVLKQEGKAFFTGSAKRDKGALQMGFDLKDEGGRGISVYRKDRRIEVRWRLLGKDGKEIAAGAMNYG
jgi:hypothetical protein